MTNKEIASRFKLLANLMELHDENAFKIRSYSNAYLNLRKQPVELSTMETAEIEALPGVGKAISAKIAELLQTGTIKNIEMYLEKTPAGLVEILGIKGLGAKKIRQIWKELEIESLGELMYAINENRLLDLKGFGAKTQQNIKEQLEYFMESSDKQLYARILPAAIQVLEDLKASYPGEMFSLCGDLHQKKPVISKALILATLSEAEIGNFCAKQEIIEKKEGRFFIVSCPFEIIHSPAEKFYYELVKLSSGNRFFEKLEITEKKYPDEQAVFTDNNLKFYIPEFREDEQLEYLNSYSKAPDIIEPDDIVGCIHNHSNYSDGINTMEEMLLAANEKSYQYFVMTDHSRSAFYANGLEIERLMSQLDEIQRLDQKHGDIRFFSGIESDILANGDLDYPDDILAQLDLVVASVHSNLKMDEQKANARILKAIENPYTSILGHPTGRLLLSRKGYPLDMHKIIDACAANNVAIELNANPLRLDMDWRYIQYAMNKGVLISVNPDAHSIKGIEDTLFGVYAARKGALLKSYCLNAMPLEEFEEWLAEQHEKRP